MKKFLLSFLCFLMAVASGFAEETTKTESFTFSNFKAGTQYAQNEEHKLSEAVTIYTTLCHFTTELRIYSSGTNNGYVVSDALPGTITKMTFNAGNKVDVLEVYGSNDGSSWTKVGEVSVTSTSYKDYSLNFTGSYNRFKLDVKGTNQIRLKKMSVTYTTSGSVEPPKEKVATPVIKPDAQEFNKGETLSVEISTETKDATIHYTTDGTNPTEASAVYSTPISVNNTTTVKAIAVKDNYNNSEVASATYTMVDPNAKTGTISFASADQRVSQDGNAQVWRNDGITFTNNKASSQNAVVSNVNPVRLYAGSSITIECSAGNITKIEFDCNTTAYATELKNSIGDAATISSDKVTVILDGTSNSFEIAKLTAQVRLDELTVTYSAGATKPVAPTLTAGGNFVGSMEVEIFCATEGAVIYYTTDGTEPTEDSEVYTESFGITETTTVKAIAVNEAGLSNVATAVYTRVAATPEISFNEATFEESVEVTITAAEGTTAYYTLNSKTPTEDSDECPGTLTLKANATLQVIAYDEDGYASPLVKQTFTKKASDVSGTPIGMATLVKDATDLAVGDQVVIVASDYNYALSTNQKSSNRGAVEVEKNESSITMNNEVQTLTLKSGLNSGTFSFYTGDGYLYAGSASGNQLKTKLTLDDKGSFTINIDNSGVATVISSDVEVRGLINFNYNNGSPLFACYDPNNKQSDVSLYKVDISTVKDYVLNVTSAGWSTLYLDYNVAIPENVTCYVIDEVGEGSVTLTEVTGVLPANTAVIVEAGEGEYTFDVTEESATVKSIMAGTTKNEYVDKDAYVLGKVGDEVGLYKAQMMGGVFLNNANKAYLPATAVPSNAKALKFNFDTTGMEGVKVETEGKKVIYDLSGRRVNEMAQPGIYIVNGKKVMVK